MNKRQKKNYFGKRVQYWCTRMLIDDKLRVSVGFKGVDELEISRDDSPLPEWLKQEEMLVSTLERVLLGEEEFKKAEEAYAEAPYGTLGECDDRGACYLRFTVYAYPALMELDGDTFKCAANRLACHEVCHILLWPVTSYMCSLEGSS